MSHELLRNPSKRNAMSLASVEDDELEEITVSERKWNGRHLKYLIIIFPAFLVSLAFSMTDTTSGSVSQAVVDDPSIIANPFANSVSVAHYIYKFVTMIAIAWIWMGSVRLLLYLSPAILIFCIAKLKLPVEALKNAVEHFRSIAIPLARFSMFVFMAVYYYIVFDVKNGALNNKGVAKNAGFNDFIALNGIIILAVLSGLIFVESICIRNIGVLFDKMAFADRIKLNNIALKTIDKLEGSIGKSSRELFVFDLTSKTQATNQSKRLFEALSHGRDEVVMSDFVPYFQSSDEAQEAFNIFDKNKDGDIIRSEMRSIVQHIYEERRALTNSLHDIKHAIAKLNKILISVCFFVTFFVALAIFSDDPIKTIVPFSSFLIGLSFVFGQSARDTFDSILFVFVTHPFDTNDVVLVKDERLIVKELGLLTTTFIRFDGQECYFPNSVLNKQTIFNIRRSKAQGEVIKVDVGFDTTMDQITQLNILLKEFLAKNSRDYDVDITVNVIDLNQMSKLTLTMMLNYKRNWMDGKLRMRLKTKFNMELKECLSKLNFRFSLPLQPFTGIEKTEKVE